MRRIFTIVLIVSAILMFSSCARKQYGTAGNLSDGAGSVDDTTGNPQEGAVLADGTACGLFEKNISAAEALELAKASDVVVIEKSGCTSGQAIWDRFLEDAEAGKRASVLIAHYYTLDGENISPELYEEQKDRYPVLYFYRVDYDGSVYSVKIRESSSEQNESEETYQYLRHYTGNGPETALFDSYEYYTLTDDEDVTWDEIMKGYYSSDSSTPRYRHVNLYESYKGWKGN